MSTWKSYLTLSYPNQQGLQVVSVAYPIVSSPGPWSADYMEGATAAAAAMDEMEMARRIPGTLCCALVLVRPEFSLTGGDRSM